MYKRTLFVMTVPLWVLLIGIVTLSFAAGEEIGKKSSALTTVDSDIPVEELELILKALTKEELLAEALGWQILLRAKVAEIGKAEITVMRQSREIAKTREIQEQAKQAKQQLDELQKKAVNADVTGDAKNIQETERAVAEARETVDEIQAKVVEATELAKKTAEIQQRLDPETREGIEDSAEAAGQAQHALEKVQEAVTDIDVGDRDSVRAAGGKAGKAIEVAQRATGVVEENIGKTLERVEAGTKEVKALASTVDAMDMAETAQTDEKIDLLETINTLREERTLLIDNLDTVLVELKSKTAKEDTETMAKIADYLLYINSVQGISLDFGDTTSNWIEIKGWLTSEEGGLRWAENIAVFLATITMFWVLSRILSRVVRRALQMTDRLSKLLTDFLVGAVRWIVMAIGIIMALAVLEVSVGPLLAVIGAAGFVIAFALQDSLSNFASGIMILFFRPFDVGDVVEAGGISGKVKTMNLVATTIKTFDNKDMVVPNNKIWRDVITNATGVTKRRVDMEFGIGYEDDIDQARKILEDIVGNHPKALKDPAPTIRINTLADSSVIFICRPWTRTEDYWTLYWDVMEKVKRCFDAEGIGIPYPQRDVHLYIEDAAAQEKLAAIMSAKEKSAGVDP